MGRGVSSGGGQSSLGYLFGSDAPPPTKPVEKPEPPPQVAPKVAQPAPPAAAAQTEGQASRNSNNYHRADGQNSGNFITVSGFSFFFSYFHTIFVFFFSIFLCFSGSLDQFWCL
jgi:SPIRAL1-like protein